MAIGVSQGTELRFQGFFDISGNIFEKLIVIHRWLSSFCVVVQAGPETEKAPDGGVVHQTLCKRNYYIFGTFSRSRL